MTGVAVAAALTNRRTLTTAATLPPVAPAATTGLYLASNADPRTLHPAGTWISQYHSIGQTGAAIIPGYPYVDAHLRAGGTLNLVVEIRVYGATPGPQAFTVEGRTWTVPAPTGYVTDPASSTTPKQVTLPAWSYRQIVNGACDGLLHRLLAALRPYAAAGYTINVQAASEVDTDNQGGHRDTAVNGGAVTATTAADPLAVAAYTYMITWLKAPPAGIAPLTTPGQPRTVTFSMGWAGQWSGQAAFLRCHPDTLPVDYMAWNCYNHGADWTPARRLAETAAYRQAAGPRMRALPLLMPEVGSNANWVGGQAAYLDRLGDAVAAFNRAEVAAGRGPLAAFVWFGSRDRTWGVLDDTGYAALNRIPTHPTFRPFTAR